MQAQNGGQCSEQANSPVDAVAIVIPVLNEAAVMPRLLRLLRILDPAPAEIIAVDGGGQDNTAALARQSGFVRLIEHAVRGRAAAINRGVIETRSPLVCVLHADTILPDDAVAVIRATMQDPRIALAGFISLIGGAERVRWGTTLPPLKPETPWFGYSLGDWTDEWDRNALDATRGKWMDRSESYRQRRRRGIIPNTPTRAAEKAED